jgi:hypothetical protein
VVTSSLNRLQRLHGTRVAARARCHLAFVKLRLGYRQRFVLHATSLFQSPDRGFDTGGLIVTASRPLPDPEELHFGCVADRVTMRSRRRNAMAFVGKCGTSDSGGVAPLTHAPRSSRTHASSSVALRAEVVGGPRGKPARMARTAHTPVLTFENRTGRPAHSARFEQVSAYVLRRVRGTTPMPDAALATCLFGRRPTHGRDHHRLGRPCSAPGRGPL